MGVEPSADTAPTSATYSNLEIDQRVLRLPGHTIVLSGIVSITASSHVEKKPNPLLWVLGALFAVAAAFIAWKRPLDATANDVLLVLAALLAVVFTALALRKPASEHALIIRSSDGTLSRFIAKDAATADEARRLISDKINSGAIDATYRIDFATGTIETGLAPRVDPTPTQPPPAAERTQPPRAAFNGAAQPTRPDDRTQGIAWPPGSPFATGPKPQTPQAAGDVYVDFGAFTAAIVEMHRFYARQPNAEHVEQRLSELEMLMRAGGQTGAQKSRVRDLVRELSQILQAYPPAVQIFQQIGALTGPTNTAGAAPGQPR